MFNHPRRQNYSHQVYSLLLRTNTRTPQHFKLKKLAALLLLARFAKISKAQQRRSRRYHLLRSHLLPDPRQNTDWRQLRCSFDDRAYLGTTGLDVASFEYILQNGFERLWSKHTLRRHDVSRYGRPRLRRRSLLADGVLALTLRWLTSTASYTDLQQIFALVHSVVSRYISSGIKILARVLSELPEGRVAWPSPEKMGEYSDSIQQRHPGIEGAFGFIDGLHIPVEVSSDPQEEQATYNGWLHSHQIGNMFVFAPDGKQSAM